MGCCCKFVQLTFLVGVLVIIYFAFINRSKTLELPEELYKDHYWGERVLNAGDPLPKDDETINPFKVVYDEAIFKDLQLRLEKTRFVQPLIGSNFENGFNGDYLQKVVHHWRNNYDWKKQVDYLNSFSQFTTEIEGLKIHFVRIKPLGTPKVIKPLVLVNGWPSNYYQFYKLADLLRKPENGIAFEIVIPSRPGFGFSEAPKKPGFSLSDSVRIYQKLMKRLGHNHFFYHGEDWGAIEGHVISALYPDNIDGTHFSMAPSDLGLKGILKLVIGSYLPSLVYSSDFEANTFSSPSKIFKGLAKEIGYFWLQATKPDTIGASLIDSPAGLAAYYLEKFSTGINKEFINLPDGGLTKKINLDELLTNIMIFWTTENGAYSVRYYKEFANQKSSGIDLGKAVVSSKVPVGFTIGQYEIDIGKMKPVGKYNIVKYDYLMNVGHFPSFENPKEMNQHLRKFLSIVMNSKPTKTEL